MAKEFATIESKRATNCIIVERCKRASKEVAQRGGVPEMKLKTKSAGSTSLNDLHRAITNDRLPTNTTTKGHAIHRWFNFIAGFSPEYVALCCSGLTRPEGKTLLDPFTGCGTALVAARQLGMNALGFEPHPVFGLLAIAKSCPNDGWRNLEDIKACLTSGFQHPVSSATLPESPRIFLGKLIPPEALERLLGARKALETEGLDRDPLAFLVLSKLLDRCSSSQTDGIYKAPTSQKRAAVLDSAFDEIIDSIRTDVASNVHRFENTSGCVFQSPAQKMNEVESESVDIVVTSPPYLNNFDYAEMTRMYSYFWGMANTWGEITDSVRKKLIVNTTTALKGHKDRQAEYKASLPTTVQKELEFLVAELALKRKIKAGKKEYDLLIYPYFAQMMEVLHEAHRVLVKKAKLHMMVSDAALYGVHIPAPQLLAHLMQAIGFKEVMVKLVRKRGHRWVLEKREGSIVGLGEYEIVAKK